MPNSDAKLGLSIYLGNIPETTDSSLYRRRKGGRKGRGREEEFYDILCKWQMKEKRG
jgi:hypothetical protein